MVKKWKKKKNSIKNEKKWGAMKKMKKNEKIKKNEAWTACNILSIKQLCEFTK